MEGMVGMSDNNGEDKKQNSLQRYLYAADKERLRTLLEEMSQITAASIEKAVRALRSGDAVLAEKVIGEDDLIDEKEEQIDQECLYSIATRQPMREDLRFVYSVMKIIVDLERIGDQAVNIAMGVRDLPEGLTFPGEMMPFVEKMAEENIKMIEEVMQAFEAEDETVICATRERRKLIKKTTNDAVSMLDGIIASEKVCGSDRMKLFCAVILILRHLSRISDHVLNLAERVSFIATGISPLTLKKAQEKGRPKTLFDKES